MTNRGCLMYLLEMFTDYTFCERLPRCSVLQKVLFSKACPRERSTQPGVSASLRNGYLELLTNRARFFGDTKRNDLMKGSVVETLQETPCSMRIQFGCHYRNLELPFPVDGSRSDTTVAREQFWIEVSVPTSSATRPNGYMLNPFPVVRNRGRSHTWGMRR